MRTCWLVFWLCILAIASCEERKFPTPESARRLSKLPPVMIWAWERPEELKSLDPAKYGIAFLAQTLTLSENDVLVHPRRQPLNVPPQAQLVAVTRIESRKKAGGNITLSDAQKDELVKLILRTREMPNVTGVQIDFDVVVSERGFYRKLLTDLRSKLPDDVPLSITALASFCLGDRWLDDLPVDEVVPMIFRMGADDAEIKRHLENGGDFREPLCRTSYGISLDEPLKMQFDYNRRVYIFNDRAWTDADLDSIANWSRK